MSRVVIVYQGGLLIADGAVAAQHAMEKVGVSLVDGTAIRLTHDLANKNSWVLDGYLNSDSLSGIQKNISKSDANAVSRDVLSSVLGMYVTYSLDKGGVPPLWAIAIGSVTEKFYQSLWDEANKAGQWWGQNLYEKGWDGIAKDLSQDIANDEGGFFKDVKDFFRDFWENKEWLPQSVTDYWRDFFNKANHAGTYRVYDPLILDLDGDGIETLASNRQGGAMWDHDGDGIRTASGWVKSDDGFLVLDRNGNGLIDDGSELFGDRTKLANGELAKNGFAALADLDSNGDGKVDAADQEFAALRVWRDLNGDGVSSADELFTLEQLGIKALNTGFSNSNQALNGNNVLVQQGSYVKADGGSGQMGDVNLAFDPLHSRYQNPVALNDTQKALPTLQGYGRLRELREAAALSPALGALLTQYQQADTRKQQMDLLPQLLLEWAKTDPQWSNDEGLFSTVWAPAPDGSTAVTPGQLPSLNWNLNNETFDATPLKILYAFSGEPIQKVYLASRAEYERVVAAANALQDQLFKALLPQTLLKPYLDQIELKFDGKGIVLDFAKVDIAMGRRIDANWREAMLDIKDLQQTSGMQEWNWRQHLSHLAASSGYSDEFMRTASALWQINIATGEGQVNGSNGNDWMIGSAGQDLLKGGNGSDLLEGGDGDDTLIGGEGGSLRYEGDTLRGGAGNDVLTAAWNGYNNTLEGGAGNDTLSGSYGRDVYLFNLGDGQDEITDNAQYLRNEVDAEYMDELRFGAGIRQEDVKTVQDGNDLIFQVGSGGDSVRVKNWFADKAFWIERVIFADGSEWNARQITYEQVLAGGSGNDALSVVAYSNGVLKGGAGDDVLIGWQGSDTLQGGAGNDLLKGGNGSDLLEGGDGDDTLIGGEGGSLRYEGDTLRGGAGNDVLAAAWNGYNNTLEGGAGNDTLSGSYGRDVYLFNLGDGQDEITDNAQYFRNEVDSDYLDELRFGAGIRQEDVKTVKDGDDLIFQVGSGGDSVRVKNWFADKAYWIERVIFADGSEWNARQITYEQVLAGGSGNDALSVVAYSNGVLKGGAGDDVLIGWQGSDTLQGGAGNDLLKGGNGSDLLEGGDGDDTLIGGEGGSLRYEGDTLRGGAGNDVLAAAWNGYNNTLEGGAGNDTLSGSYGRDVYLFNLGDGQDEITDNAQYFRNEVDSDYLDELRFGAGIRQEDVKTVKDGDDLIFQVGSGGDSVRVKNWFADKAYWIERVIFADGSEWNARQLTYDRVLAGGSGNDALSVVAYSNGVLKGGAGDDVLIGWQGSDTLQGGAGNDLLKGGNGSDVLEGGDGDDTLIGGEGGSLRYEGDTLRGGAGNDVLVAAWNGYNNTLEGGAGNDTLSGSYGRDVYLFNLGDGQDEITDNAQYFRNEVDADYMDELRFGSGINSDQLWFRRSGDSLELSVIGSDDKVTVNHWFADKAYQIELIKTGDGKTLAASQVLALVDAMAAFNPPAGGQSALPADYQASLQPVLASSWH